MPLVAWDEKLSVGIEEFDDQHKQLIQLINSLHDAMKVGKSRAILGKILDDLISYTRTHFGDEEIFMQTNSYEGYPTQKIEHEAFVRKISEFRTDYENGRTTVSLPLMDFLKHWLVNHIKVSDRKYSLLAQSPSVAAPPI